MLTKVQIIIKPVLALGYYFSRTLLLSFRDFKQFESQILSGHFKVIPKGNRNTLLSLKKSKPHNYVLFKIGTRFLMIMRSEGAPPSHVRSGNLKFMNEFEIQGGLKLFFNECSSSNLSMIQLLLNKVPDKMFKQLIKLENHSFKAEDKLSMPSLLKTLFATVPLKSIG